MGIFSSLFCLVSGRTPNLPKPKSLGEWILHTSPTPFNRFVTLRSPSIDFSEIEFPKFVKQNVHYVRLKGEIIAPPVECSDDKDMVFQRLYVKADDGGFLALDWPANLDLEEERYYDCTILIIPETVEGSGESKIRCLVCDCLRRSVFPIVMNPRGCASRLTTPRLFTAADSNDISIVVRYITMKRPQTTLMAIGWKYSANMLTKYLAEFGDVTPIVAAICIDNPFDLEEATRCSVDYTRSSVYHQVENQRQRDDLIRILQANKELFQGRGKRFDVKSALSASSLRDFEKAISMVSYGFDNIEDFYAKASTRNVIYKVKVPVLFIQDDDGRAIPRIMIAENPYTSLLLCSYNPSSKLFHDRLMLSWCQHITLEWLKAVELVLRKDRHPPSQPPQPFLETPPLPLRVGTHAASDKTNMDKENQNGMGNSYKNTQPPGGNTAKTDVAIMGEPNTGQDSSRTLNVSDGAEDISNERKVERVPEQGQSNPEEEDDLSSDQDKKSEPCKTEENSKPQGYNENEIDSHPRSKNSDNITLDSCESQNQNEELKKDSVSSNDGGDEDEQHLSLGKVDESTKGLLLVGEGNQRQPRERQNNDNAVSSSDEGIDLGNKVMVGAFTAALLASALIAHQHSTESVEPLDEEEKSKESFKSSEMPEKTENNIVASPAEKEMPVASPVVPIKEDGEVDHGRPVSMLAKQGQKVGISKLVGKVALLWGGVRGAMCLTDKLISFLRLAERPRIQRIPGFVFMVLLLWSPVLLPMFPTLMHVFRISEFACIVGLYISIMIMITLSGKRIREYDDPLLQYGFDLAKLRSFPKGFVGGAILVTLIHAINWSLGCRNLLWPTTLSSFSVALVKAYGHLLLQIVKGIVTATGVAAAEELLFQSRLPREIDADFGYPRGVFISGLVFALSQRSIWEIPGLWLLAMSLSGARRRSRGNLALPIGLRAGILAAGFILRTGGFLVFEATTSYLSSILAVNFILTCFINVFCSPLRILGTEQ